MSDSAADTASDTPSAARRIAVFDLDVTLTRYDTYLPFLFGFTRRYPHRSLRLAMLPLRLLALWRWRDRQWVKHSFLTAFVGGQPRARLDAWAEKFAARIIDKAMREPGLKRLRAHQDAGDRVVLASASFDIYVEKIARHLNIDEVLASRLKWDADDRLQGMDGPNCRHAEKLRRVQALLGQQSGHHVTAYSDSHADLPLLAWAESGVAVCPSKRLTHQVAGLELEVVDW